MDLTAVGTDTTLLDKHLSEGTRKFDYGQAQEIILDYTKHLLREQGFNKTRVDFNSTSEHLAAVSSSKKDRIILSLELLDKNFMKNAGFVDVHCLIDMIGFGSHSCSQLCMKREFKRESFEDYSKTSLMKEFVNVTLAPATMIPYISSSNTEIISRNNQLKTRQKIMDQYNITPNSYRAPISAFNETKVELFLKHREFIGKSSDVSHAVLNYLMLFPEKNISIPALLETYPNLAFEFKPDGTRHTYREILKIKETQLEKHPDKARDIESYFFQMIRSDPLLNVQFIASISDGSLNSIREVTDHPVYIEEKNFMHLLEQETIHYESETKRLLRAYKKAQTHDENAQILKEAGSLNRGLSCFSRTMNMVMCRRECADPEINGSILLKISSFKNRCRQPFKKLVEYGNLEGIPIPPDLCGRHNFPVEQIRVGPNPFFQPKPFNPFKH